MPSGKPVKKKKLLLEKITKRPDYVKMRNGHKVSMPGFILQGKSRAVDTSVNSTVSRYGLTCSKRIGNAVKRNRAKRRLRSAAMAILPYSALEGWDYVLIGKTNSTENMSFDILKDNLITALRKIHQKDGEKL